MSSNSQTAQQPQRRRFKLAQDWQNFVPSIIRPDGIIDGQTLYKLRIDCYSEIEKLRKRPLIVYATRFLEQSLPPNIPVTIDISDVDGFTDLVNCVQGDSVDVLIHSPGGSADATERIVQILRNRFKEVHFLVPHSAYSAATMLALSGNTIGIHPSATLGPIDPQINGTPARSIKRGFEKVRDIIKTDGPESLPAYLPLIEKYSLDLLELCDDSEKLSKELVSEWLKSYMFIDASPPVEQNKIDEIVTFFSDYDDHKTHARPLHYKKIQKLGLNITELDGEVKDLVWEAYLVINGFFQLTAFYKLFECVHGVSWGRQIAFQQAISPVPPSIPPVAVKP